MQTQKQANINSAVLMCHAPIVIPEIAGSEISRIAKTTLSMQQLAKQTVAAQPECLVLISPHTPRHPNKFGLVTGNILTGSFKNFGHGELKYKFSGCEKLISQLSKIVPELVAPTTIDELDHGALVPLHFLAAAGWSGPTLIIALPWHENAGQTISFAQAMAQLQQQRHETWSLVASGDMSHRLIEGAPAGFHPRAREFDQLIIKLVASGNYEQLFNLDEDWREDAAEDVVSSVALTATILAATKVNVATTPNKIQAAEVLSYEGPFGVGYLCASLLRT